MVLALVLVLLLLAPASASAEMLAGYDGTPLDATITLPQGKKPESGWPLVVFLHGLLADKSEYLSDDPDGLSSYKTAHWNNKWFARRGYAVLNYSARGHGASGGSIELASRDVEVRDARTLISTLVDRRVADPRLVVVAGSSYGGGQAWLLLTTKAERRLPYGEWRTKRGRRVRLAAVVPQYTWTDLVQSLVPNGRASSAEGPIGVAKVTLIDGFLASAGNKLPDYAKRWLARTTAGEPYEGDATVDEARRALSVDRSAWFQDGYFAALRSRKQRAVPVFAAQGLTDPIFSAQEAVRMATRLRATRPGYPIALWFGDFEHLTSLVKIPELEAMHDAATNFIDRAVGKRRRPVPYDVHAVVTNCDPQRVGELLHAQTWAGLGPRPVTLELPGAQETVSPLTDPRGPGLDPVAVSLGRGRGCLTSSDPVPPGVAVWDTQLGSGVLLAGAPHLTFQSSTLASDLTYGFRLWDVAPGGLATLVSRGAWRSLGPETVDTELNGATWRFPAGHTVRLEIAQTDAPYLRPDNFPSAATVDAVRLVLPAR